MVRKLHKQESRSHADAETAPGGIHAAVRKLHQEKSRPLTLVVELDYLRMTLGTILERKLMYIHFEDYTV